MTSKEIKKQIRELKAEMKALGIKKSSCFNGGHSSISYRYNAELFRLSVDLEKALAAESKTG